MKKLLAGLAIAAGITFATVAYPADHADARDYAAQKHQIRQTQEALEAYK